MNNTIPNELMAMVCKRIPTLEGQKAISSSIPWIWRTVKSQTRDLLASRVPMVNDPPMKTIIHSKSQPMSPGCVDINGHPHQLFIIERPDPLHSGLSFVSLASATPTSYLLPKDLFASDGNREWIRIALVIDSSLFVLVESATNEGNLHILQETSVHRHFEREYPTMSVDNLIRDIRVNPLLHYYINLSTGTWYMVENIGELCGTHADIAPHVKQRAPWGTEMNKVITGCYAAFLYDYTLYNKPLLLSRDYLVFHLPNFDHPIKDRLLVFNCRTKQCRTIQLPFDVTSYGSIDMMWIIVGQTMKIARPGHVIQPVAPTIKEPIFALDLENPELVFVPYGPDTMPSFKGYPDQTLSLTHVNYYDDRLLLRVNAQIDDYQLLISLYYKDTLLATWSTDLPSFDNMIYSLLISDEGKHIIISTTHTTRTIHIESLVNKFVIPG